MSLRTHNFYGAITVTDEVVASIAGHLALECYGVVDMIPTRLSSTIADIFRVRNKNRGVKVVTKEDRIYLELYVVLRYGINIGAVAESLRSTVKYGVEKFTGMIVNSVDVHIVGIRL